MFLSGLEFSSWLHWGRLLCRKLLRRIERLFSWRVVAKLASIASVFFLLEVGLCELGSFCDFLLELVKIHLEIHVGCGRLVISHLAEVLQLEIADLPHEVAPILDVVDLRNQLLFEPLRGVKALVLLADHHLQVIVRLLDLGNVYGLELQIYLKLVVTYIGHLVEPLIHDFLLVLRKHVQLSVKIPLPHDLRVLYHLVDQLCAGKSLRVAQGAELGVRC